MPTCPACAETISDGDENCPYCGISIHEYAPGESGPRGPGKSKALVIGLAVAGVIAVLLVCVGVVAVPVALLVPATQQAREAARRSQCKNNLKQIGLALHNYHEAWGSLPPAYLADENGKPMHSWRVLILPFLDEAPLYQEYRFSEPWDGPNNSRLMSRMPRIYSCPSHAGAPGDNFTAYAAVFGADCAFRGAEPVSFNDISDGTSNTMLVGEATHAAIPWMKPDDVDVKVHPAIGDKQGFSSDHTGGINVLMGDGAVRFIPQSINPQTLQALFSRAGDERIGDF
jgi:prepilin-type processing-associated H-X9-DG protein